MKLTLYLFNSCVESFQDAIKESYLTGDDAFIEVPFRDDRPNLDFEAVLYHRSQTGKAIPWASFLGTQFALNQDQIRNKLHSAVLLLKAGGRVFAVPFGHGYHALKRSALEFDFGLLTALNALGEDGIKTVDTRNVDIVTRQQRTNMNRPSGISAFGLDEYVDWIRSIDGKPEDSAGINGFEISDEITSLSGSESLKIGCKWELLDLANKCEKLLTLYQSDAYKEKFAFIDRLKPVTRDDRLNETLDAKLLDLLASRDSNHVTVAVPDIQIDYTRLDHFNISQGRKEHRFEELNLEDIYTFLDQLDDAIDPKKIMIVAKDENDALISSSLRLRDYLVAEIRHEGQTYVLSLGLFFRVSESYLEEVERKIQSLEDYTDVLRMPPIGEGESEGSYNQRVALTRNWFELDKELVRFNSHTEKVEVCDILTPGNNFICVKKMTSSATLSHLFSQGSVSASLMKEPRYLEEINRMLLNAPFDIDSYNADNVSRIRIIYALPTRKPGPIANGLFFFSRINLLTHVDVIRRVGLKVALCKIEYEEATA